MSTRHDRYVCPACQTAHIVVEVKATYGASDRYERGIDCEVCGAHVATIFAPEEGSVRIYREDQMPAALARDGRAKRTDAAPTGPADSTDRVLGRLAGLAFAAIVFGLLASPDWLRGGVVIAYYGIAFGLVGAFAAYRIWKER